jgi:hypothetical protein
MGNAFINRVKSKNYFSSPIMPPSKISTASRSKGVSMRGGRKTKKSNYYGKKKSAPTYYIPRATARYGLTMSRARNSYAPSVSKASNSIPKYTLAVVRPFSDNAIGAKVPDMNSMPSATSFSREIVSPKLNQSGYSFTAYRFQHTCTTINGTPASGQQAVWPVIGASFVTPSTAYGLDGLNYTATPNGSANGFATQDPCYQSMVANYLDTRTVACGIRVQCNLPALTACGFIHIACVPEDMLGSAWQYPTTFAAMERAPFYQKVPLANLINNQANINLPIMDQGAWRYRNTALLPSNVGASFVQSTTAASGGGTTPVQVTQQGTASLSGTATVTFGVPFIGQPVVQLTAQVANDTGVEDITITPGTVSATGFSCSSDYDNGGSTAVADSNLNFNWTATGYMTPANYALYTPDGGEALTVQNIQLSTIPGIETTYGWGACIVALEMGAFAPNGTQTVASTSPIEVEVIRHYEAIPNDNVGNIITGTAAERHSDAVLTGTKNVQSMTGAIQIDPDSGGDGGSSVSPSFADKIRACTNWAADVASAMHPVASVVVQGVRGMQSYIRGRQARGYAYRKVVVQRTD